MMLADMTPEDYSVKSGDYFFSDQEIMEGVRRAVAFYNGRPPRTIQFNAFDISQDAEYMFMTGACWQVCLARLEKYKRKETTYQTGGVSSKPYEGIIKGLADSCQRFRQDFIAMVEEDKASKNMNRGFLYIR